MIPKNDREAISLIIDGLIERGCAPTVVRDGANEDHLYITKEAALDDLTSCDESVLFVDLPAGAKRGSSYIYFVLGNEPREVACDYEVSVSEFLEPIVDPWWD